VELYQTGGGHLRGRGRANAPRALPPALEAIAHTLADDAAIMGDRSLPAGLIASVTAPALVISGEQSPPFLRAAARAVAQALPNGRLNSLPGQGHDIWTAPGILEALIPGRMQSHASTAEVPR
jgi:pimeloyl-ACP methyl ester carboxylesterase